ncbi:MAG: hypothetical protein Q4G69_00540 [Planctomycetia bacterium]|nr:hypothetical protein [Planctomycetia bacterium]
MDADIPKCTKVCFETKKPLKEGDRYFSILIEGDGELVRQDYSAEAWEKRKNQKDYLCFWSGTISGNHDPKIRLAPNDILLNLFDELEEQPDKADIRYVLALLLIRRRIFRYEREDRENSGSAKEESNEIQVYSPRRELVYSVPVVPLDDQRIDEIQNCLASLLYTIKK